MEDSMRLRRYSTGQLLEELARRTTERGRRREPKRWCDDCSHFVAWVDAHPAPRQDCPNNYNPCAKGHTMRFMVPEEIGDAYGFYREVCADRAPIPEIV